MLDRYNFSHGEEYTCKSRNGEWVRYDDVAKLVEENIKALLLDNSEKWGLNNEGDPTPERSNYYRIKAAEYYISMLERIRDNGEELVTFAHVETPAGTKEMRAGREIEYTTDISVSEIHFKRKDR